MPETKNIPAQDSKAAQPRPGAVIAPSPPPVAKTPPAKAAPVTAETAVAPPPAAVPEPPQPPAPPAPEAPEPPAPPAEAEIDGPQGIETDGQGVTWTASEFVAHDKSPGWYFSLAVVALSVAVLIFIITRDLVSVAVVVVAGLLLGIFGSHKPRQLEYRLDNRGIGIGQKHFSYDEFRSFSVADEGAFASVVFMPLKRFALPTTIYYAPDDEEKIIAVLSDQLPFEEHRADAVDKLMRRIRF